MLRFYGPVNPMGSCRARSVYLATRLLLWPSTKKKKKKEANNKTQIRRCCMQHLIRTYTVWELIYQIWDRQTVLIKTKKKRKKTGAFKRCIRLSLSVKVTFDLLDTPTAPGVLQSQCIHLSHKQINYQTTVTDDSCYSLVYHTKDSEVFFFFTIFG